MHKIYIYIFFAFKTEKKKVLIKKNLKNMFTKHVNIG